MTASPPAAEAVRARALALGGGGRAELFAARYRAHVFPPHAHAEHLFGAIVAGEHAVSCRGRPRAAAAGTVVTMDPGDVHHGGAGRGGAWSQRMLTVDGAALGLMLDGRTEPGARAPFHEDAAFCRRFARAHAALLDEPDALAAECALQALVEAVAARHLGVALPDPAGRRAPAALRAMSDYLRDRPGRPVGLDELAAAGGLRRRQAIALFQAAYGLPPHRYHLVARLEAAKALLRRGTPAADCAAATGFADQSHLTRHFRAAVGLTPARYAAAVAVGGGRAARTF